MIPPGEPLDRFLARRGQGSWAGVRQLIHRSRVQVDGVATRRYHQRLLGGERVEVDGVLVADGPDTTVLLCHKPAGLACSRDPDDIPLIYAIVPAALDHPDLHTCGRLDRSTTGLIVLTIDGAVTQRLTDPAGKRWKRYRVVFAGRLADDAVERVAAGMVLPDDGTRCRPARLLEIAQQDGGGRCTLELCEGRYHQVKRMILALGARVEALHRDRIGALELPADLAPGQMRAASAAELAALEREA
jgi:16S rRNA pseudouridine516 synthase